jgi:hypothetical protein
MEGMRDSGGGERMCWYVLFGGMMMSKKVL